MSEPVSSSEPYVSASDFLKRYDARTIGQLMSDESPAGRTPTVDELTNANTVPGGRLSELLKDASGMLEIALLKGGRYTIADLEALTANQAAFIKRVVGDLALGLCYQRRPATDTPIPTQTQVAMNVLDMLANGDRILGLQGAIDASHMTLTTDTPDNVLTRNSMVIEMQGYFGTRGNRWPQKGRG